MKQALKKIRFGMRGKLLLLISVAMLLLYLTVNLCLELMIRPYMSEITLLNLRNAQNQRVEYFDEVRARADSISETIIEEALIQKSLLQPLAVGEKTAVRRLLISYCNATVQDLLYVDSRGEYLSSSYSTTGVGYAMAESLFEDQRMNDYYAIPTWSINGMTPFSEMKDRCLYVTQNIRHMNFDVPYGRLVIRFSSAVLNKILETQANDSERIFFLDHRGDPAFPKDYTHGDLAVIGGDYRQDEVIVQRHTDSRTGWTLLSYVRQSDLMRALDDLRAAVLSISTVILLFSLLAIVLLTKHYMGPIGTIVAAMQRFSKTGNGKRIETALPGELAQIGESFNAMATNIENLLEAEKRNRETLKIAELDSLTYQINPHFIYNTLDNIYMLSRMSGDRRIGQLIDALSKLLRISLSKGSSLVKLQAELDHVTSYLLIQQIRYDGLFTFSVSSELPDSEIKVLKLILQPFVENAINHGFAHMEAGGEIHVSAQRQGAYLSLCVADNGAGIQPEIIDKYNRADKLTGSEIEAIFPNRKGGYGIGNVIARLNLYYKDRYHLHLENTGHGTRCEINLPLNPDKGDCV